MTRRANEVEVKDQEETVSDFDPECPVGYYKTDWGKVLIELVGEPERAYFSPRRSEVRIEYRDPWPRATACNGKPMVLVSAVKPLTKAARALLAIVPPKVKWSEVWL